MLSRSLRSVCQALAGQFITRGLFTKYDSGRIEQARNIDIILFLENRYGFTFTGKGGGFRCEQHPSLAVKDDRSSFYWHSRGTGGYGVIDFLMKIENMSFYEAMESINIPCFTEYQPPKISQSEISKNFILPEKTEQQSHIFNYLYGKRGIAFEIVTALIEEEKIYGDVHGNSAPAFGVILIVERQPTEQYLSKNTDWSLLYYAKYF